MNISKLNLPYERAAPEEEKGLPYSKTMKIIHAQWREAYDYWNPIYEVGKRDKQFCQSRQWDAKVEAERDKYGVATVTWPLIRNFYNHQLGKALPGSVDIAAVCLDPNADIPEGEDNDAATNVLNGMMRFINKMSKAGQHRQKARRDQYSAGIGWLGMDWFPSTGPSKGELHVFAPKYFNEVFIDPYFRDPDAADAMYAFHPITMPWDEAVGRFGNRIRTIEDKHGNLITLNSYDDCDELMSTLDHCKRQEWLRPKGKSIVISTHYWRRKVEITTYEFKGTLYSKSQWKEAKELADASGTDTSDVVVTTESGWMVERRTICGWSILEEETFFLDQIPWTPVFGYTQEDGESYTFHGIVHDGVNLQEHANWLASQHATKTSTSKTIALIGGGVLDDGAKPIMSRGGVDFYAVDMSEDNTGGNGPAQLINSPDDGTKELEYLKFTIELLRQVMSTDNDNADNQVIRSAEQLGLHITDRDSVREELDQNYRSALECHYAKMIKGIQELYDDNDIVRIVNLSEHDEEIGTARLMQSMNYVRYAASVKMTPSGTAQKQQSMQISNALIQSGDPQKVTMGLILGVDNTELTNKRQLMKKLYKQQFAQGVTFDIPPQILQEIVTEAQETGQIEQMLKTMAEPMAQQMLQEMLQSEAIKVEMAKAASKQQVAAEDTNRSRFIADKARTDAQRAVATDTLQREQQVEQTKQEQLRTARQFYELQQEIAEAQAAGIAVRQETLQKLLELQNPYAPVSIQPLQ